MKTLEQVRIAIDKNRAAEKPLSDKLSVLEAEYLALQREKHFLLHGVRPGSLVITNKGKVYKVVDVRDFLLDSDDKPWLHAHLQKKDGTFSERVNCIYDDWTLVRK